MREQLRCEIDKLQNRKEELDNLIRNASNKIEEENYNISYIQKRRDELWDNYGEYAQELENLLEEEKNYIEKFKREFEDYQEQIEDEYNHEMENIDNELSELLEELHNQELPQEEGEEQDGDW